MEKKYSQLSRILKKLLFERNMRPSDLARELNMPPPTIHRIVTGESMRPYKSSLIPIADFFKVSVNQLIGKDPLPIDSYNQDMFQINKNVKIIPLIPWEALGSDRKLIIPDAELVVMDVSTNAFAAVNPDYSMEPLFQKGSILIFDPDKEPLDRSCVLVKLEDPDIYVFRQLLIDVNQKHIKALNPDIGASSIRFLTSADRIIARVVESRNKL